MSTECMIAWLLVNLVFALVNLRLARWNHEHGNFRTAVFTMFGACISWLVVLAMGMALLGL